MAQSGFDLFLLVAVLAAFVFAFVALLRRGGGSDALDARLAQLAEAQAAHQAQIAEGLREQERALARALEERLGDFGKRVGERLNEGTVKQQESLSELRERLAIIDKAQQNITELSTQVVELQDILTNKQARGAFGEAQLEALVRDQLPQRYYEFQATLSNRARADCLIKLPPPLGPLAVDAKFPREAWDALRQAGGDEAARQQALRMLGTDVMKHVRDIAEKYIIPGETAEAALMFVPSEAIYATIYDGLGDLADKARRAKVFIVSPTTLWAVLNTMRAVLKDVHMREQAHLIQQEVHRMLEDVGRLAKRVDNLDNHFRQAARDVEEIQTSARKIQSRGEKLVEIEVDEPSEQVEPADSKASSEQPQLN